ncbi:MAG: hypothetical protein EOO09_09705 [Chitinophagaceae bacterium]|nr:MAG: hypothetical protein EOO09_09705 [Chitinophagaceae bacterium]
MYNYELLENGCHYLVKEKEDSPVTLIKVAVETDHCVFIRTFDDEASAAWKMKKDGLFDIIECLTDEAVKAWEEEYTSQDAFYEEDDE